jgi:hypothetical protein
MLETDVPSHRLSACVCVCVRVGGGVILWRCQQLHLIASNSRMTNEWLIGQDFLRNRPWRSRGTVAAFVWRNGRKVRKTLVSTASLLAERLPSKSRERYRYDCLSPCPPNPLPITASHLLSLFTLVFFVTEVVKVCACVIKWCVEAVWRLMPSVRHW